MPNGACYDNRAGLASQEWEDFQMMHDVVQAAYCADNNRIEMAGYSSGGWVANMWGCYFGGIPTPPRKFAPNYALRARASVTGGLPAVPPCSGPVAGIWIHDAGDTENVIKGSYDARDLTLKMNNCANSKTMPWPGMPDVCVQYVDCPKEYPVVFCTTNGQGHSDQPSRAIPGFKKFYDMLKPTP
jgi:poly(3-hydroxybutyrate) depolymerase